MLRPARPFPTKDPINAVDMLDRLKIDPGQRTLGELLQEREWALREIISLRDKILRSGNVSSRSNSRNQRPLAAQAAHDSTEWTEYRRLIKIADVCKMIGLSRPTIYRLMWKQQFPNPVRVSARAVRWNVADIIAWQDARA